MYNHELRCVARAERVRAIFLLRKIKLINFSQRPKWPTRVLYSNVNNVNIELHITVIEVITVVAVNNVKSVEDVFKDHISQFYDLYNLCDLYSLRITISSSLFIKI